MTLPHYSSTMFTGNKGTKQTKKKKERFHKKESKERGKNREWTHTYVSRYCLLKYVRKKKKPLSKPLD